MKIYVAIVVPLLLLLIGLFILYKSTQENITGLLNNTPDIEKHYTLPQGPAFDSTNIYSKIVLTDHPIFFTLA